MINTLPCTGTIEVIDTDNTNLNNSRSIITGYRLHSHSSSNCGTYTCSVVTAAPNKPELPWRLPTGTLLKITIYPKDAAHNNDKIVITARSSGGSISRDNQENIMELSCRFDIIESSNICHSY